MSARDDRKGQKIAGVAAGVRGHNADVTVNALTVRPLARDDLPRLSRWLAEPHVAQWWRDPSDLPSVEASYLPCIDGTDPAEVFVIEVAARAAGKARMEGKDYVMADGDVVEFRFQATSGQPKK